MMNEVKERMRLFPTIDKDGYKRLERLIDSRKEKLSNVEQARLKAEFYVHLGCKRRFWKEKRPLTNMRANCICAIERIN